MKTLGELFAEDEERRLEITRREMAEEKAAWEALPQEEKDRLSREAEEKWASFDSVDDFQDEEEEEDDE